MPSFSFAFKKKPAKVKAKPKDVGIVAKRVKGVVHIDMNAIYSVHVDGRHYRIRQGCYSCRRATIIYRQGCDDPRNWIKVRDVEFLPECNRHQWLPFRAGSVVIGNIVINRITREEEFDILQVYRDFDNNDAVAAFQFYRKNYKKINSIIRGRFADDIE